MIQSLYKRFLQDKPIAAALTIVMCPTAILLQLTHASAALRFIAACAAIVPLSSFLGNATEKLADRLGHGIGGLLNATFGNAAELIVSLAALFKGLDDVVKASLTGSILGNLLLVLGASFLAGGIKYPLQHFQRTPARVAGTMMALAAIGLIVPAIFHFLVGENSARLEHRLSAMVAGLLIITYILGLIFSLLTHRTQFFVKSADPVTKQSLHNQTEAKTPAGVKKPLFTLIAATVGIAIMSEILVGAIEEAGKSLGLTSLFMGVVVVAIVGNAAEHATAVFMARKNQMDLAVGIALGSATQIALFVAPVLVFASYLRPHPMDLLFSTFEVASVILSVLVARMVAEDGESTWLEGAMLLMLYAILAIAFFELPGVVH
jgi:Ca2+:H+ antiporter